jgi:sialidase-1
VVAIISNSVRIVCLLSACAFADDIQRTTVFQNEDGGYPTYRIPSILVSRDATLLAFCEGRAGRGDSGKIHLLLKRSSDGGKSWSDLQIIWADVENTCGNPCPVVDQTTGTIWMLMTHNLGSDSEKQIVHENAKQRTVWVTSSSDDGKTWAQPREITKDVSKPEWAWYATGPGVGIQLQRGPRAGRLVVPCDRTVRGGGKDSGNSHVIYSDDHGATWKLGGEAPEQRFNECQVVELSDGRVMLNMRNVRPSDFTTRAVCVSDDGGETFKGLHHDAMLVEPICQGSILRFGDAILFSNPADSAKRINMTVRMSRDDGETWPVSKVIHEGPSAYSCLVALTGGDVGLLYECGAKNAYERIELARFKLP